MISIFNKNNKKNSFQRKSDHSDSETIDGPGPSTSHNLCEREHQSVAYLNNDNENVFTPQILDLGLGDVENGTNRPILAVSTILVLFYIIILSASKIL